MHHQSGQTAQILRGKRIIASGFAGLITRLVAPGASFVVGSDVKIGYDIMLFPTFRNVKPPEKLHSETAA
jgi:hypothetical protein